MPLRLFDFDKISSPFPLSGQTFRADESRVSSRSPSRGDSTPRCGLLADSRAQKFFAQAAADGCT